MRTEKSADEAILDSVFSSSRDRGADSAAPVVEDAPASVEAPLADDQQAPKTDDVADETKPKGYRDPNNGRFVPLDELKTEREKRQEAQKSREEEARLRAQAETDSRRYQDRVYELERAMQARENPPKPPPDPVLDPEAAFHHMQNQMSSALVNQNLNFSERMARKEYGGKIVDEATQAALQAGVNQHFLNRQDPYEDLIKWHKRQSTLQRIGDDPDAYDQRVRDKVLEEIRTGKVVVGPGGQPAPQQRLPGSLIDATSSGQQGARSITDGDLAKSIFGSDRKRK